MRRSVTRLIAALAVVLGAVSVAQAQQQDPYESCLRDCWDAATTRCVGQTAEWCTGFYVGCTASCSAH